MKFEVATNLQTAKHGVTVPADVLTLTDKVIK